jgi:hypothetical protein|tara:strand:+ start:1207 stop:1389 length:183 start_codon:yes stop_codon:yes gene_type:complete
MTDAIIIIVCLTIIIGILYYAGGTMFEGDLLDNDDFDIGIDLDANPDDLPDLKEEIDDEE